MYNLSNKYFTYKNQYFNYCINSHNTRGSLTERVVEIPLLKFFLDNISDPVEIGCVSPYYFDTNHLIYDPTDTHHASIKEYAQNIDIKGLNIVSISTIEHFDQNDYHSVYCGLTNNPIIYIEHILKYANYYLITVPLGYNIRLTNYLLSESAFDTFLVRTTDDAWITRKQKELTQTDITYNFDIYYANSICVIENIL